MQIRKGGIYHTINAEEFGLWQAMGFEKVVTKNVKVETVEPIVETIKEPVKETVKETVIDELPKSKKKKK